MINLKTLPAGPLIAIALLLLLLLGFVFLGRPAHTRLAFDNQPDHSISFSERGPTRLMLRMTEGAQAEIVSVTAAPAGAVRILAHPGACAPARMLTENVPVCAVWIEPGPTVDRSARLRVAYRTPGKSDPSELVLRVR